MRTRAGVLRKLGANWEVIELELDPPGPNEVLIRYVAAGFCHSDEHLRHGDIVPRFPIAGGHEGAGIVNKAGPGSRGVKEGDHVVFSFLPSCGHCRWCASGMQNLCDLGATILQGCRRTARSASTPTARTTARCASRHLLRDRSPTPAWSRCPTTSRSRWCLVGCGVGTGWGSAVYSAEVRPATR